MHSESTVRHFLLNVLVQLPKPLEICDAANSETTAVVGYHVIKGVTGMSRNEMQFLVQQSVTDGEIIWKKCKWNEINPLQHNEVIEKAYQKYSQPFGIWYQSGRIFFP